MWLCLFALLLHLLLLLYSSPPLLHPSSPPLAVLSSDLVLNISEYVSVHCFNQCTLYIMETLYLCKHKYNPCTVRPEGWKMETIYNFCSIWGMNVMQSFPETLFQTASYEKKFFWKYQKMLILTQKC